MIYNETLMWKEICETPNIFKDIYTVNEITMKNLVQSIKQGNATNFVAAARGTSENALIFLKYLLEVNSPYTLSKSSPSVVTLYKGKVNYANSIVIGCSQSGMAEDVLEIVRKANEQGAITISVTNNLESPLAKEAKFHLYCNAGLEQSVAATKTFSAQLYLMLWLASELCEDKAKVKMLKNLSKEIENIMPEIDKLTSKYAEKFKGMQSGFVLSRGITYPIAPEAALKLQETCYIQMKGYAGSNFYHGPMAMVNENTPVIIYAAENSDSEEIKEVVRKDQIKCVEQMLKLKAPVLLVTNDCVLSGMFSKCNGALIKFSVSEDFAMFAFAMFAQMFACKISCAIGNNPDQPRALSKVTITW